MTFLLPIYPVGVVVLMRGSTLSFLVSEAEEQDPRAYHDAILSMLNGVDTVPLPLEGLLAKRASRPAQSRRRGPTAAASPTPDLLKRVLYDTTRGGASARRPPRKKKNKQRRRAAAAPPPHDTYAFEQTLKEQIVDLRKQRGSDRSGASGAAATSSVLPLGEVADLFDPALLVPVRSPAQKRSARPRKRLAAKTVRAAKPRIPSLVSGAAKRPGLPALATYPTVPRASSKSLEMLTPQQKRRAKMRRSARKPATAAPAARVPSQKLPFSQFEVQLARSIAAERRAHASAERTLANSVDTVRAALSSTNRAIDEAAVVAAARALGGTSGFATRWKRRKQKAAFNRWIVWGEAKAAFDAAPALRRAEQARIAAAEALAKLRFDAAATMAQWYRHWHIVMRWTWASGTMVQNRMVLRLQRSVRGRQARRCARARARLKLLRQLKRIGNGHLSQVRLLCDPESSASVGTAHVAEPQWRWGLGLALREATAGGRGAARYPLLRHCNDSGGSSEDDEDAEVEAAKKRHKLYRTFAGRFGPLQPRQRRKGRHPRSEGGSPVAASASVCRAQQRVLMAWGWGFGREYARAEVWVAALAADIKSSYAMEKLERRAAQVAAAAAAREQDLFREQTSLEEHLAAATARENVQKAAMAKHEAMVQRDIERRDARRARQAELLAQQRAEREKALAARKREWAAREWGDRKRNEGILEEQAAKIKHDVAALRVEREAQAERDMAFAKQLAVDQKRLEGQVRAHRWLKKEAKARWERKYLERKRELQIGRRDRAKMMAVAKEEAVNRNAKAKAEKALNAIADKFEEAARVTRARAKIIARAEAKASAEAQRTANLEWSKAAYGTWAEREVIRKAEDECAAAEAERTRWITGVTLFRGILALSTIGYVDVAAKVDLGADGLKLGDFLAAGDRDRKARITETIPGSTNGNAPPLAIVDVESTDVSAAGGLVAARGALALECAAPAAPPRPRLLVRVLQRGPWLHVSVYAAPMSAPALMPAVAGTAVGDGEGGASVGSSRSPPRVLGAQLLMRAKRSVQGFPLPNDTWGVMCAVRTEAALVVRQMLRVAAMGARVEADAAAQSGSQMRQKATLPVKRACLAAQTAALAAELVCLHAHAAITSALALKAAAAAEVSAISAIAAVAAAVAETMRSRVWDERHRAALARIECHKKASESAWEMVREFMSRGARRLKVRGQHGWCVVRINPDAFPIDDPERAPIDDDSDDNGGGDKGAADFFATDIPPARSMEGRDAYYFHEDDESGDKCHYQWDDPRKSGRAESAAEQARMALHKLKVAEDERVAQWIVAVDRSSRKAEDGGDDAPEGKALVAADECYPHAEQTRYSADVAAQATLRMRVQYKWNRTGVLIPSIRGAAKSVAFAKAKLQGTKKSRRKAAARAGNARLTAKYACAIAVKCGEYATEMAASAQRAARAGGASLGTRAAFEAATAAIDASRNADRDVAHMRACRAAAAAGTAAVVAMRAARTVSGPMREFRGLWLLRIETPWCAAEGLSVVSLRVVQWANAQLIEVWLAHPAPSPILMLRDMQHAASAEYEWPLHEGAASHHAETKEYLLALLDHHAAASEYASDAAAAAAAAAEMSACEAGIEMALIAAASAAAAAEYNAWSAMSCVLVAPVEYARRLAWDQTHDAQRQKLREGNAMREAHWAKLVKKARAVMPPRPPTPLSPSDARLLAAVAAAEQASVATAVVALQTTAGVAVGAAMFAARTAVTIAGRLENEIEMLLKPESSSASSTWDDSSDEIFEGAAAPPAGPPPSAPNPNEAPAQAASREGSEEGGASAVGAEETSDDTFDELEEEVDLPPMGWIKYVLEQKLWIVEPETGQRARVVPDESGPVSGKYRSSRKAREKAARMVQRRFRGIIVRRQTGRGAWTSFHDARRAEVRKREWMRPRTTAGCVFFSRQGDGHCQWEDPRDAGVVPSSAAERATKLLETEDVEILRRMEWNWNTAHFTPLSEDRVHEFAGNGEHESVDGAAVGLDGAREVDAPTAAHKGNLSKAEHGEARLHALLVVRTRERNNAITEVSGVPAQYTPLIYSRGHFGVECITARVEKGIRLQLRSEDAKRAGAASLAADLAWRTSEWARRCEEALEERSLALVASRGGDGTPLVEDAAAADGDSLAESPRITSVFRGCFRLRIDASKAARSTAWTSPQSAESESLLVGDVVAAGPSVPRADASALGQATINAMTTTDLIKLLRRTDTEYDDCITESDLKTRVFEVAAEDALTVGGAVAAAAAHAAGAAAQLADGVVHHALLDASVSVTLRVLQFDGGLKAFVRVLPRSSPPPFTWTSHGHTSHLDDVANSSMEAEQRLLHRLVRVAEPVPEAAEEDEQALSDFDSSDSEEEEEHLDPLTSHHSVHEALLNVRYTAGVITQYDPRHFELDNDRRRVRLPYLVTFDVASEREAQWIALPSEHVRVAPSDYGVLLGASVELFGAFHVADFTIDGSLWMATTPNGDRRIANPRALAASIVSRSATSALAAASVAARAAKHAAWTANNAQKSAASAHLVERRSDELNEDGELLPDEIVVQEEHARLHRVAERARWNATRRLGFATSLACEVASEATTNAQRVFESALVAVDRSFVASVTSAALAAARGAFDAVDGSVRAIEELTNQMYRDARDAACREAMHCATFSATVSAFQTTEAEQLIGTTVARAAADAAESSASFAEQEALAAQRAKEYAARWELLRAMDWGRFRRDYVAALNMLDYMGAEKQKGRWTLARRLVFEAKAWGNNGIGSKRRLKQMKESANAKEDKPRAARSGKITCMVKKKKAKKGEKLKQEQKRRAQQLEVDPGALLRLGMWLAHPKRGAAAAPAALVVLRRAVDVCDLLQDLAVSAERIDKDAARAKSAKALAEKKKAVAKARRKIAAEEMLARKGIRRPKSSARSGSSSPKSAKGAKKKKKKKTTKKRAGKDAAQPAAASGPSRDMMAGVARRGEVLVTLARLEEAVAREKCKRRGGGGVPDFSQANRRWQGAMKHAENVVQPQLWLEAAVVYESGGDFQGALAVYGSVVSNFPSWSRLGSVVLHAAGALSRNNDWASAAQYLSHPSLLDSPPAPLSEADAFLLAAHARELAGESKLARQGLKEAIGAAISGVPVHLRNDDTVEAARRSADARLPSTWWRLAHKCDAAGGSLLAATVLERAMRVERRARRAYEKERAAEEEERQRRLAALAKDSVEDEVSASSEEVPAFALRDEADAVEEGFELFGLAVVPAKEWAWRASVLHASRTAFQLRVGAAALLQAVAAVEAERKREYSYSYASGEYEEEEEDEEESGAAEGALHLNVRAMQHTAEVWNLESHYFGDTRIGAACPAAMKLQTILRGRWSRRAVKALMKHVKETRAARAMQRAWRYRAAKLHIIAAQKEWKELEAAAIPLQRRLRRRTARRARRRRVRGFEAVVCVGAGLFHDGSGRTTKTSHLEVFAARWSCAVCGKVNAAGQMACEICGRSKPVRSPIKARAASPQYSGRRRKAKQRLKFRSKAKAKAKLSYRIGSTLATLRVVSATTDDVGLPVPDDLYGPRVTLFSPKRAGAQFVVEGGWDRRLAKWVDENPKPHGSDANELLATLGAAAAEAAQREANARERAEAEEARVKQRAAAERKSSGTPTGAASDSSIARTSHIGAHFVGF